MSQLAYRAPAQQVSIAGQSYVLPANARPDLAYTTQTYLGTLPTSNATIWKPLGGVYDFVTTLTFMFQAGTVAVNRLAILFLNVAQYAAAIQITAAGAQVALTAGRYTFSAGITAGYVTAPSGASNVGLVQPLPLVPLTAGGSAVLVIDAAQIGDLNPQFTALTVVSVPTGPQVPDPIPATAVATPLLA